MTTPKKKKKSQPGTGPIDLNLMPFIDVFSVLTTFLLLSSLVHHIGVLEVQVAFFSNKPPPQKEEKPEKRQITVNVTIEKKTVTLETFFEKGPRNRNEEEFDLSPSGIQRLHSKLHETRTKHPGTDKLTLFADDDIQYETIVEVLDAIKFLGKDDPPLPVSSDESFIEQASKDAFLYPKIIFGDIVL